MNKKYYYKCTKKEDMSIPNNNYPDETEHIVTDGVYDFGDWLRENLLYGYRVDYDATCDTYYVIDDSGERTGEAYIVISEEDTTESISR